MWKDIIGWEKYYEINEHGDVRNKLTKHLVIEEGRILYSALRAIENQL